MTMPEPLSDQSGGEQPDLMAALEASLVWCADHPKVTARVRDADGRLRCAHPDHNSPAPDEERRP